MRDSYHLSIPIIGTGTDYSTVVGMFNRFGTLSVQGPTGLGSPNLVDYRLFTVGNGQTGARSNAFSVDINGNGYFQGAVYVNTSVDFAEYFESDNGHRLPVGTPVVLLPNGKIRAASPGEHPIGVISNNASFIGNAAEEHWSNMYLRDSQGGYIYEDIKIETKELVTQPESYEYYENVKTFKNGQPIYQRVKKTGVRQVPSSTKIPIYEDDKFIGYHDEPVYKTVVKTERVRKLNPKYDNNRKYLPRSIRPEWNVVGILGVVKILNGTVVHPNWIKLGEWRSNNSTYTYWYIC